MGRLGAYPLRLLLVLVGVCGGPRFLLVDNVATKVVESGLALVDSVDHTFKKLPSLVAAVVVDDTLFQAVGKGHQVL